MGSTLLPHFIEVRSWLAISPLCLSLSSPICRAGIRTPTPEALMGMQGDLIRQVQSLAGGGLVVEARDWPLLAVSVEAASAEGLGFWKLVPQFCWPVPVPRATQHIPCPCNG